MTEINDVASAVERLGDELRIYRSFFISVKSILIQQYILGVVGVPIDPKQKVEAIMEALKSTEEDLEGLNKK